MKVRAWDDTGAMVEELEARRALRLPLWAVYSYDDDAQYKRKMSWYASQLKAIGSVGSMLDIGCGTGEILNWYEAPAGYLGVDLASSLITDARLAHPDRRFECYDVLTEQLDRCETVIMIGLLGLSPHPLSLIERASELARVRLLFDFLVTGRDHRNTRVRLRYLAHSDVIATLSRCGLCATHMHQVGANVAVVACR
jgi:SAM-dependent methyltransferase